MYSLISIQVLCKLVRWSKMNLFVIHFKIFICFMRKKTSDQSFCWCKIHNMYFLNWHIFLKIFFSDCLICNWTQLWLLDRTLWQNSYSYGWSQVRVGGKLIGNSESSRSNLLMVCSYCKIIGQKQLSICHNRDAKTLDIFPDSASQSPFFIK